MAEHSEATAVVSEAIETEAAIAAPHAPSEPQPAPIAASDAPSAAGPAPIAELKLPPAPQLGEPAPSVVPPPFLREHEHRPIVARRPPPPKPGAPRPRPATPESRKSRFPLLAGTMALAAALGGAAGSVGIQALVSAWLAPAAPMQQSEREALRSLAAELTTEVGALRTSVEQYTKLTANQYGKLTERLERTEHAQGEPAAKIAKIAEAVERIERNVPLNAAKAEVTGSVTVVQPPLPEPKPKPAIIEDYVVRKVFDGVALVEGRRGIMEVEPGSTLPGAGRVEEIRRQDGRWVVVTSKGLITSAR
jgi:hypothetical protein